MKTILIWLTLFTPALALDYNLGYQPVLVSLPTPPLTSTPVRQMQTAASAPGTQYTAAPEIFSQSVGTVPPTIVYSAPQNGTAQTVTYWSTIPDHYVGPTAFSTVSTGVCTSPGCSSGTCPASVVPTYWQPFTVAYPSTVACPVCAGPAGYCGR